MTGQRGRSRHQFPTRPSGQGLHSKDPNSRSGGTEDAAVKPPSIRHPPAGLRRPDRRAGAGGGTIRTMQSAREYFDYLNHAYVAVHKTKEDLFWATYMAISDEQAAFSRAEGAYKEFVGDPAKLAKTREELARVRTEPQSAERDALLHGLGGWLAL